MLEDSAKILPRSWPDIAALFYTLKVPAISGKILPSFKRNDTWSNL